MSESNPTVPTVYTVRVTHHWNGEIDASFEDVGDSEDDKAAVAFALRRIADNLGASAAKEQQEQKVLSFPGVQQTRSGESQTDLVKVLADLFEQARGGELQSLIGTGFTADGSRLSMFGGVQYRDVYQMLGALAWLQHEYVARVTGNIENG